jgi:WD40 repeat protein
LKTIGATRALLRNLCGHTEPVTCVAFTPDSQRLILGSQDGTVRV